MIDVNPNHLETITRILAAHVPECEVRAFGSRVTWTAKDYSDLDLAVVGARPLDPDVLRRMKEAFENSNLPFRVDVLDWYAISAAFQKVIEKKYEVVQKGKKKSLGIADEWPVHPLEDCMAAIIDYRGKTPQKTSFGIPLITAKVVKGGRIETPDEFIAIDDYEAWMRRGIPKAGDVVITTEAPLGEVAQLGNERVALAQRLIGLRGKSDVLDNGFLKFLMQSTNVQDQLRARASGTTVLGIKQSELRKILLTLPPIAEQRAIAHILGTLDDKIELNRRMNETLETMARALFKSWFVDFDPVRAKAEGRDPGLPQPLADLFPDSFEDSELGEIPKGWRHCSLGDLVHLTRGRTYKSSLKDLPGPVLLGLASIKRNGGFRDDKLSTYGGDSPVGLVLYPGDMFASLKDVTQSADLLGAVARVPAHVERGRLTQDTVKLNFKSDGTSREIVYRTLLTPEYRDYCRSHATGTTNLGLSRDDFLAYPVMRPSEDVQRAFDGAIENIEARSGGARTESRTLAALRDTLLPKLISGELRVKGAYAFLGGSA